MEAFTKELQSVLSDYFHRVSSRISVPLLPLAGSSSTLSSSSPSPSLSPSSLTLTVIPSDHIPVRHSRSWLSFGMDITITVIPLVAGYLALKFMKSIMMQDKGKKGISTARKRDLIAHVNLVRQLHKRPPITTDDFVTDAHEDIILNDVVLPNDIPVTLDDIGGIDQLKNEIYEAVILPLQSPKLFASSAGYNSLTSPPRGVLFYGPPGTGKTMMAKAIAHECRATFINVKLSSLEDKYYGETAKLIRALFSVASRLSPCIIFLDELDQFFPVRTSDSSRPVHLHAEFLVAMDGLTTRTQTQDGTQYSHVCVLGATNRPNDIDRAIQRRLPRTFLFDLPNLSQRRAILSLLLSHSKVDLKHDDDGDDDGNDVRLSISELAIRTSRYSGSDLTELCKYAAMEPVKEHIKIKALQRQKLKKEKLKKETQKEEGEEEEKKFKKTRNKRKSRGEQEGEDDEEDEDEQKERENDEEGEEEEEGELPVRAINRIDFINALKYVQPTGQTSAQYQAASSRNNGGVSSSSSSSLPSSSSSSSSTSSSASTASYPSSSSLPSSSAQAQAAQAQAQAQALLYFLSMLPQPNSTNNNNNPNNNDNNNSDNSSGVTPHQG